MKNIQIISHSEKETRNLGARIAKKLRPGSIVCLTGNLGSGKTTFVKGMATGLKIAPQKVNSPTFVLMNIYEGVMDLYHYDFYRLEKQEHVEGLGYEEYFEGDGVCAVEWAGKFPGLFDEDAVWVTIVTESESERTIRISPGGGRGALIEAGVGDAAEKR